jgi:hypothetical protein
VLGVANPISTELEVAVEPGVKLRPKPRAYVLPVEEPEPEAAKESSDAWLDALGGVVKRVPILGSNGVVIDHRLLPVIGGKIEGGHPDKVVYFRQEDDSMRGFRVYAGDLLLTIPCPTPVDDAIMLLVLNGVRMVRKIKKQDGGKLLLQSYNYEYEGKVVELKNVLILGRCVRLEKTL